MSEKSIVERLKRGAAPLDDPDLNDEAAEALDRAESAVMESVRQLVAKDAEIERLGTKIQELALQALSDSGQAIEALDKLAARGGAEPSDEMEMALCESVSVVLREGQLYRFIRVDDCEKCEAMSKASLEAYGEPPRAALAQEPADAPAVAPALIGGAALVHPAVGAPVVAEPLADWAAIEQHIDEYVSGYVMEGDAGSHSPSDDDRFVIKDAIMGLTADPEFIAMFVAAGAHPSGSGRPALSERMNTQ